MSCYEEGSLQRAIDKTNRRGLGLEQSLRWVAGMAALRSWLTGGQARAAFPRCSRPSWLPPPQL
jgi:hypothetical protein